MIQIDHVIIEECLGEKEILMDKGFNYFRTNIF